MAALTLQSITARGFLSYHEPTSIEFRGGAVAVCGKNGSGKSTITSKALTWCLYGETSPERMGSGAQTIKGKGVLGDGCADASVTVTLAATGLPHVSYAITRTRKKTGSDQIAVLGVHEDGRTEALRGEQGTIDRIIGVDHDVFVRTVVRGQGDPWNFAEATDKRKREIVDAVSGAEALDVPLERAKKLVVDLKAQLSTIETRRADAQRRKTATDIAAMQRDAAAWEAKRAESLQTARAEHAAALAILQGVKQAEIDVRALEAEIAQHRAQVPTLDFAPYDAAIAEADQTHNDAVAAFRVAVAEWDRIQGLQAGSPCPMCAQTIGAEAPVLARKAELNGRLPHLEYGDKETARYAIECRESKRGAEQWLTAQRDGHRSQLSAMDAKLTATRRLADPNVVKMVEVWASRVQEIEQGQNPFGVALANAETEIRSLDREIAVFDESIALVRHDLALAECWVTALGPQGARAHMAEATLSTIETEANRWLSALSAGTISVSFASTRETAKGATKEEIQTALTVRKADGTSVERSLISFSGGEKRRINLAVDLGVASAFGRGRLALSALVLDEEAFSGVDADGKRAIVAALNAIGVHDVIVIDHDPALSGVMPRTITIVKDGDVSKVVQ
jgi:DNA repair exonuclease SbcCD ATPase subunit